MPHAETQSCLEKAESLIEIGDADSFRYASLQLRMGIEYLFYELIPLYRDELPDDILTKWQPKDVLDAVLACDPSADKDAHYAFGSSEQLGPAFKADLTMESKAPTKRILKQHYHRLGFYLHAPDNMVNPPLHKWRADLEDAANCLRQYRRDQILSNVRVLIEHVCICGKPIKRNKSGVESTGIMQCHDSKCRAIFDVKFEDGKEHFSLRQESYDCPYCRTKNYVSAGSIKDGLSITCVECGKRVVVRPWFQLVPVDAVSDAADRTESSEMSDTQLLELYATVGNVICMKINAGLKPSPTEHAISMLMGRLVESGNTMRELFDHANNHNWVWDGISILRTSFDAMLQAMYILHDPSQSDELARQFLDFQIVEQVRMLRVHDKRATTVSRRIAVSPRRAKNESAIMAEYARVCTKYGYDQASPRTNWYPRNLEHLAKKTGYLAEYEIAQKQFSAVLHSSAFGLATDYLTPINVARFQWDFALRVLGRYASILGVNLNPTEKRLVEDGTQNIFDIPALEPQSGT